MNTTQTESAEKKAYSVDEICKILHISTTSAYKLLKTKKFKYVKVGRMYRISKVSFDQWLKGEDLWQ